MERVNFDSKLTSRPLSAGLLVFIFLIGITSVTHHQTLGIPSSSSPFQQALRPQPRRCLSAPRAPRKLDLRLHTSLTENLQLAPGSDRSGLQCLFRRKCGRKRDILVDTAPMGGTEMPLPWQGSGCKISQDSVSLSGDDRVQLLTQSLSD